MAAAGRAILLSDRAVSDKRAAVPALLAVSCAWRAMTAAGAWKLPLIVETGQVIDTHHVALLVAAGASAVHPYLAMSLSARADLDGLARYRAAIEKGLRKVLARMGISTMSSYRNSQIFETIGLDPAVCEEFFEDAGHTLSGKTLDGLLEDCLACHAAGFGSAAAEFRDAGLYRFRRQRRTAFEFAGTGAANASLHQVADRRKITRPWLYSRTSEKILRCGTCSRSVPRRLYRWTK